VVAGKDSGFECHINYIELNKTPILTHNQIMKRILLIGCGDIALRVAPLIFSRYRIFGLIRNNSHASQLRLHGIIPIFGDLDYRDSLAKIGGLADIVLHFAPPPNSGEFDIRTRNLLASLSQGSIPKRLIYISTSGVYGDCSGSLVSESRPLNAHSARAQRRVDAENRIRAWAQRNGVNAQILRVPGIYAVDRLPLERLRAGSPAIVASQDSYTNHIHADDLARIVVAAIRHGKPNRVYNASDDSDLRMGDYFDAVADKFGLPRPPRLSREQVKVAVSPVLWSFMEESRRMTNMRIKKELRVKLNFPTVGNTLSSISDTN
jgi:nucleoside-diphosphate-sugar epimerase